MKAPKDPKRKKARQFWMRQLHQWHWISAALSLVGMLFFAITGITLNHADLVSAQPKVESREGRLSPALLAQLKGPDEGDAPVPAPVAQELARISGQALQGASAEWTPEEVNIDLPRPGGDGWVRVQRADGAVTSETTSRGAVSLANDLHKGRHAGGIWVWFLDIFAAACVIFTLTGLLLLQVHAKHRPSTWPIVAAGLVVPVLLLHFFVP
ncbi:hypothetical protein EOE18_13015 [Novosphingobium umbonatum]|uniref:Peptidase n=1 Tax=Novosphingobium umbonatum TaxID=1908524 RepID=A0A437N2D8_9SPHN|nr:PepSY-associated TM helix domain-containing protein [Novosphingobium umbonatum]RVU04090.1 hypothetical protein EOE18_13015 [Novosphingobium umbonatum]